MPTYPLIFPCPIPVGHRVRLTWYQGTKSGFFSGPETRPEEPLVEDLETRVLYAPSWIFLDDSYYQPMTRPGVPDTPRADLRKSATVEGVVVSCHIVPVRTKQYTATYLTLEETPAR